VIGQESTILGLDVSDEDDANPLDHSIFAIKIQHKLDFANSFAKEILPMTLERMLKV
jgi:hypothetical protein